MSQAISMVNDELLTEDGKSSSIRQFNIIRIWNDINCKRAIFKCTTKEAKFPNLLYFTFLQGMKC